MLKKNPVVHVRVKSTARLSRGEIKDFVETSHSSKTHASCEEARVGQLLEVRMLLWRGKPPEHGGVPETGVGMFFVGFGLWTKVSTYKSACCSVAFAASWFLESVPSLYLAGVIACRNEDELAPSARRHCSKKKIQYTTSKLLGPYYSILYPHTVAVKSYYSLISSIV